MSISTQTNIKKGVAIFAYFAIVRILYVLLSGFSTCELCSDCQWINMLSERALVGNFDFDIGRFIVAPFYNVFIAAHKFLFQSYWSIALIVVQIVISALSGVYFYKLARLLFSEKAALLSTAIFGIFPMTLYWVHTFCTESIFQSLLIISLFYLVKSIKTQQYTALIASAVIYSITFLTKSHILLFSPFIALFLFLNLKGAKKNIFPLLYGAISLAATLPFGLHNLQQHNEYVLASNGSKFHFYTGNSAFAYHSIVRVPPQGTEEFRHVRNMNMAFFNGDIHHEIMKQPHAEKQDAYLRLALDWIQQNPMQFLELKAYNLGLFLFPGVSFRHYPFKSWLFSFLISLPIYIFGYIGLYKSVKNNFKLHFFALGLFVVMLLFATIWYVQNRFRTITIEPIYILYAGFALTTFWEALKSFLKKNKKINNYE